MEIFPWNDAAKMRNRDNNTVNEAAINRRRDYITYMARKLVAE